MSPDLGYSLDVQLCRDATFLVFIGNPVFSLAEKLFLQILKCFCLLAVSAIPVPPPIPHLDEPGSVRPTTHESGLIFGNV